MNEKYDEALNLWHHGQANDAVNLLLNIKKNPAYEDKLADILQTLAIISIYQKNNKDLVLYVDELLKHLEKKEDFENLKARIEIIINESSFLKEKAQRVWIQFFIKALEKQGYLDLAENNYFKYLTILEKNKIVDLVETEIESKTHYKTLVENLNFRHVKNSINSNNLKKYLVSLEKYFQNKTRSNDEINEIYALIYKMGLANSEFEDLLNLYSLKTIANKKELMRVINLIINFHSQSLVWSACLGLSVSKRLETAKALLETYKVIYKKDYKNLEKTKAAIIRKIQQKVSLKDSIVSNREDVNFDLEDKLNYLKAKLNFHEKYKENQDSELVLRKIQGIDPYFTLEQDLSDSIENNEEEILSGKINTKESFQDLLSQITYYAAKGSDDEELHTAELKLKKIIELKLVDLDDAYICDYIVMLHSFQFYDLALLLVQKWKEVNPDYDKKFEKYLEVSYLEIMVRFELKKHYENLSALKVINTQFPLKLDEKVCFFYLEAETYFDLKMHKQAANIYRLILKMVKDYRLTSQRLKEIEKN